RGCGRRGAPLVVRGVRSVVPIVEIVEGVKEVRPNIWRISPSRNDGRGQRAPGKPGQAAGSLWYVCSKGGGKERRYRQSADNNREETCSATHETSPPPAWRRDFPEVIDSPSVAIGIIPSHFPPFKSPRCQPEHISLKLR